MGRRLIPSNNRKILSNQVTKDNHHRKLEDDADTALHEFTLGQRRTVRKIRSASIFLEFGANYCDMRWYYAAGPSPLVWITVVKLTTVTVNARRQIPYFCQGHRYEVRVDHALSPNLFGAALRQRPVKSIHLGPGKQICPSIL